MHGVTYALQDLAVHSSRRRFADQLGARLGTWKFLTFFAAFPMTKQPVVFINVFTVEPDKQSELVELLTMATQDSVRHAHGFISATLHRSLDGTKVTMYALWRSQEHYQAMRENPAPLPYLQRALAIATFDPGMYEIVQVFSGIGDGA